MSLVAVYDLAVSPPTFDFIGFLITAEAERIKRGEHSLRVVIVPGPDHGFRRDSLAPRDPVQRRRMLDNIVIPMCRLLPSCVSVEERSAEGLSASFPNGWQPNNRIAHYGTNKLVEAWKAGVFPLTTGIVKPRNERLVTITLREADYWPSRNSNKHAWSILARQLLEMGYDVYEIGDGDLQRSDERARIYESAELNLFVGGGPHCLAASMRNANCLVFRMCSPNAVCCDPDFFKRSGLPVGSQIGRPNHRIVWADDEPECLLEETFKELKITEAFYA